jgi:hypothetical protein
MIMKSSISGIGLYIAEDKNLQYFRWFPAQLKYSNSIEQCPSSEVLSHAAATEIPRSLV